MGPCSWEDQSCTHQPQEERSIHRSTSFRVRHRWILHGATCCCKLQIQTFRAKGYIVILKNFRIHVFNFLAHTDSKKFPVYNTAKVNFIHYRFCFASGAPDNIKIWKFPDGNFLQNFSGHQAIVNTVAINSDNVLVSGGKSLIIISHCIQSPPPIIR